MTETNKQKYSGLKKDNLFLYPVMARGNLPTALWEALHLHVLLCSCLMSARPGGAIARSDGEGRKNIT